MVNIHHEGACFAPLDIAFDYIDDHRTTVEWMFGLSRFIPVTEQERGLGAVFDATFQVKPITLHSTLECTDYAEQEVIGFTSVSGFTNSSTWRFHPVADEETKIVVDFHYELPGGLAGKAMGRAFEPIVALSIRHTDAALRKHIEARHRANR